jgi:hypothetical protein
VGFSLALQPNSALMPDAFNSLRCAYSAANANVSRTSNGARPWLRSSESITST